MKTIKQIAEEVGVSKQSIRNQIEKIGLQTSLQKKGNSFVIDEKQENLIKRGFIKEEKCESQSNSQSGLQSNSQTILQSALRLLEKQNDQLGEELKIKNRQIEDLSVALVAAQETARAAQALHAGTIQKQIEMEKEETSVAYEAKETVIEEKEDSKKKTWFSRIFKKK